MRTLVILILMIFIAAKATAQQRHALIIAIDQYQDTCWRPTYADHDLPLLRHALESKSFPAGNIGTLKDTAATKAGIVQALQQLENRLSPGDFAWVHVSAHGQQLPDDNGDEIDGLDESIVPYDAPETYGDDDPAPGARHLRDDKLDTLLNAICQKIGPDGHLMVTLDVCHAGTGTRAYSTHYRGTDKPAYTSRLEKTKQRPTDKRYTLNGDAKNSFAIFAAAPHEQNFTCKPNDDREYGSLSYALARALATTSPGETCQDLFDRVRVEMSILARGQHPQSEGDGGRVLLGAGFEKIPEFAPFRINSRSETITTVKVDGGLLANVDSGSVYVFFPVGNSSARQVVRGVAETCDGLSCTVHLDSAVSADSLKTWRAELVERNFGRMKMAIQLLDIPAGPIRRVLEDSLRNRPQYQLVEAQADLILLQEKDSIKIVAPWGYHLAAYPIRKFSIHPVLLSLNRYLGGQYLRKVQLDDPSGLIQAGLEVLIVDTKEVTLPGGRTQVKPEAVKDTLRERRAEDGSPVLRVGEYFTIEIENKGNKPFYFHLLEYLPDGKINCLLPFPGKVAADYQLRPKMGWNSAKADPENGIWRMVPPYGPEVFVLVVTEQPVNLREALFHPALARSRGRSLAPLEQLFADGADPTRSPQSVTIQTGGVQTLIFPFKLIEPSTN